MPAALSEKEHAATQAALDAAFGHIGNAAAALGIAPNTLSTRIASAAERGTPFRREPRRKSAPRAPASREEPALLLPEFPDDDVPIESIIEHMERRFKKREASYAAHTWFPVKVRESKPLGLLFVGDPHLDDNGADWPLLREHARICASTAGIYAVNIGDSTNAWGGRLIRKYADQDTSLKTARRLVEWFLLDSGIRWLVWLFGNHEHMGDGSDILAQMAKRYRTQQLVMHDWEARFELVFPGGVPPVRIFAAHDMPGNSQWNPLHGPVKAAMFGKDIDILAVGHKHNWAISQWELAEQASTPLMIRTKGYKRFDDYAKRIGKIEQHEGASILVIVNPESKSRAGRTQAFTDVAAGADYLTWLRSKTA